MCMTKMLKQAMQLQAVKCVWERYQDEKKQRAWRQKAHYVALMLYLKLGRPIRKNGNITKLFTRQIQGAFAICATGMTPYFLQYSAKEAMFHVFYMKEEQAKLLAKF